MHKIFFLEKKSFRWQKRYLICEKNKKFKKKNWLWLSNEAILVYLLRVTKEKKEKKRSYDQRRVHSSSSCVHSSRVRRLTDELSFVVHIVLNQVALREKYMILEYRNSYLDSWRGLRCNFFFRVCVCFFLTSDSSLSVTDRTRGVLLLKDHLNYLINIGRPVLISLTSSWKWRIFLNLPDAGKIK